MSELSFRQKSRTEVSVRRGRTTGEFVGWLEIRGDQFQFYPSAFELPSDELRCIADKLDELNAPQPEPAKPEAA